MSEDRRVFSLLLRQAGFWYHPWTPASHIARVRKMLGKTPVF